MMFIVSSEEDSFDAHLSAFSLLSIPVESFSTPIDIGLSGQWVYVFMI